MIKPKTSVAIVGAGIIGASIAYSLASSGVSDVLVFDKGKAGSGSTAAALGGFRSQFSNEHSIRLSQESIKIIDDFEKLTGYDPLVKHDGYIFVASKEDSVNQLRKNMELQKGLGVPVEWIPRDELQERFPFYVFDEIVGGTFCSLDGHASTLAVHQGFVSKAKELGAEFHEFTEVTGIERNNDNIVTGVVTSKGAVSADKVVIAAGAYSRLVGRLVPFEIPIDPVPRRVLVTHTFTDGIPLETPLIIDVDSTLAVGREGKGILMGDNQETRPGFDLVFPPDHDERLMRKAVERIPILASSSISYANEGLYEMSPDSNPIVSSIPGLGGLYCCAGFAGHGFMHAPAIGSLMSEILLDEKPHLDISSFDIRRFASNMESMKKERLII